MIDYTLFQKQIFYRLGIVLSHTFTIFNNESRVYFGKILKVIHLFIASDTIHQCFLIQRISIQNNETDAQHITIFIMLIINRQILREAMKE